MLCICRNFTFNWKWNIGLYILFIDFCHTFFVSARLGSAVVFPLLLAGFLYSSFSILFLFFIRFRHFFSVKQRNFYELDKVGWLLACRHQFTCMICPFVAISTQNQHHSHSVWPFNEIVWAENRMNGPLLICNYRMHELFEKQPANINVSSYCCIDYAIAAAAAALTLLFRLIFFLDFSNWNCYLYLWTYTNDKNMHICTCLCMYIVQHTLIYMYRFVSRQHKKYFERELSKHSVSNTLPFNHKRNSTERERESDGVKGWKN